MQPNWFIALAASLEQTLDLPPAPPGVRILHPEDLHVTIAFLGALDMDPTPIVAEHIEAMVCEPLIANATSSVLLPREHFASVIAFRFGQGEDILSNYISKWRNRLLNAVGRPPDKRPVLPHMSIARMHPSKLQHVVAQRIRWAERVVEYSLPLEIRFKSIGLYTWRDQRLPYLPQYRITYMVTLVKH